MSWFLEADKWLLLKINRDLSAHWLDVLMPVLTDLHRVPGVLFVVLPCLLVYWFYQEREKALRIFIIAAIAVAVSDFVSYRVVKPAVSRLRPAPAGVFVNVRAPINGRLGFPSNHSANAAAAAAVLTVAYPAWRIIFATVAIAIAYSRVYVGAHYPADVLGGLLLGLAIGWPWARLMLGKSLLPGKKKKK